MNTISIWYLSHVFQGDLVQLKEMPTGASNELRSKAMDHLVMAHGLRHENINPLIGKYEMFSFPTSMFFCLFLFSLCRRLYKFSASFLFWLRHYVPSYLTIRNGQMTVRWQI